MYLLDEPISHLDAKLRHLMRGEIKAMCSERATTVIYVTHDYKEAMSLSDRILVLNKGKAIQVATPDEVYHQPAAEFVGAFLGDPSMSFLDADLSRENGSYSLKSGTLVLPISETTANRIIAKTPDGKVRIGVRASEMTLMTEPGEKCTIPAKVYVVETFGYRNIVTCEFEGAGLVQSVASPEYAD